MVQRRWYDGGDVMLRNCLQGWSTGEKPVSPSVRSEDSPTFSDFREGFQVQRQPFFVFFFFKCGGFFIQRKLERSSFAIPPGLSIRALPEAQRQLARQPDRRQGSRGKDEI